VHRQHAMSRISLHLSARSAFAFDWIRYTQL
jgi:hypothetical protein